MLDIDKETALNFRVLYNWGKPDFLPVSLQPKLIMLQNEMSEIKVVGYFGGLREGVL